MNPTETPHATETALGTCRCHEDLGLTDDDKRVIADGKDLEVRCGHCGYFALFRGGAKVGYLAPAKPTRWAATYY